MSYITLTEAKKQVAVDHTDDDTYIGMLIEMVEELVAGEIGETDLTLLVDTQGNIPKRLKHAMLLMVAHFYLVREPVIIGTITAKVPFGFEFLIHPFKNYAIGGSTPVSVTTDPGELGTYTTTVDLEAGTNTITTDIAYAPHTITMWDESNTEITGSMVISYSVGTGVCVLTIYTVKEVDNVMINLTYKL